MAIWGGGGQTKWVAGRVPRCSLAAPVRPRLPAAGHLLCHQLAPLSPCTRAWASTPLAPAMGRQMATERRQERAYALRGAPRLNGRARWCLARAGQMGTLKPEEETRRIRWEATLPWDGHAETKTDTDFPFQPGLLLPSLPAPGMETAQPGAWQRGPRTLWSCVRRCWIRSPM